MFVREGSCKICKAEGARANDIVNEMAKDYVAESAPKHGTCQVKSLGMHDQENIPDTSLDMRIC